MVLKSIRIYNYRSIEDITFQITPVNGSNTFTLIGVNESGKSSFLKGIDLFDSGTVSYPLDFFDDSQPVSVTFTYSITTEELKELRQYLVDEFSFEKALVNRIDILEVDIETIYEATSEVTQSRIESVNFKETVFKEYTLEEGIPKRKNKTDKDKPHFDISEFFVENLKEYFWQISHHITFWKSAPEYLILDEIDLTQFAEAPREISIPLNNCFGLAGIEDIPKKLSKLNSPAAIQNLEELLSEKVTIHINKIWSGHPIKIKFKINNKKLSFLVEDKGVKFKNKTAGQRSDGFRQLISFLLTLSAENISEYLSNTILLLDEPETHLHPTAQINLMNELIRLSNDENNNIVFYATHSSYMIDKENSDRCYRIFKEKQQKTFYRQIVKHSTSYSEINYEVFEIATNDYHNELYGYLEDTHRTKLQSLAKIEKWKNARSGKTEDASLPTYIRHAIHHPENTLNKSFTETQLKQSIRMLREIKYGRP